MPLARAARALRALCVRAHARARLDLRGLVGVTSTPTVVSAAGHRQRAAACPACAVVAKGAQRAASRDRSVCSGAGCWK
eukprot:gene10244-biopygen3780